MFTGALARAFMAPVATAMFGVLTVVPVTARAQARDTVVMRRVWSTASLASSISDSLAQPLGLSVDAQGRVYVSDLKAAVWVLGADGRLIGAVGRRGRGPGEYETPTGVAIGPDGRLYVRDGDEVERYAPAKTATTANRLWTTDGVLRGPVLADWNSLLPTRFARDGRLFYPSFNRLYDSTATGWYRVIAGASGIKDSLRVPRRPNTPSNTAWVPLGPHDGRLLVGLNEVPFAAVPVWDVTPAGTLLFTDGLEDQVHEFDARGREVRTIRLAGRGVAIPPGERADSVAALRRRIDSLKVPRASVKGVPARVWNLEVPRVFPTVRSLHVGADGSLWIERWQPASARRTVYDVRRADGTSAGTVVLPTAVVALPAPVLSLQDVVAFEVDPDTGLYSVVRFRPARTR